jgi:hypothetical protein
VQALLLLVAAVDTLVAAALADTLAVALAVAHTLAVALAAAENQPALAAADHTDNWAAADLAADHTAADTLARVGALGIYRLPPALPRSHFLLSKLSPDTLSECPQMFC